MANFNPPKKKVVSKKKEIEKPKAVLEQTPPDAIKPIQLKIPEGKKNEFKAFAAMRGRSMNDLFLEMFEQYKSNENN